ncbi:Uncharacterised protein [Klebsiella pneumoniae]|nr:Uncharacterised protein [Klebsiella pneumoniae]
MKGIVTPLMIAKLSRTMKVKVRQTKTVARIRMKGIVTPLMIAKLSRTMKVKVRQTKTVARIRMKGIVTPLMIAMPALPHTLTICLLMMLSRH